MFCKNCGKQIEDVAKFCPFCGTAVVGVTTEEVIKEEVKNFSQNVDKQFESSIDEIKKRYCK